MRDEGTYEYACEGCGSITVRGPEGGSVDCTCDEWHAEKIRVTYVDVGGLRWPMGMMTSLRPSGALT